MFPALCLEGTPAVGNELLHALAQLCIEISDGSISNRGIHLQVYTYSPLYAQRLDELGALASLV
jgi:hypothetical protein